MRYQYVEVQMDDILKVYDWHRGRGELDALPQWAQMLIKFLVERVEGSLSAKEISSMWDLIEELAGTLAVLKDEVSNFSGDQQMIPDPEIRDITVKDIRSSVNRARDELETIRTALVSVTLRKPGLDAVLLTLKHWPQERAHHMLGFVMQVWDKGGGALIVRYNEGQPPTIAMEPGTSSDNSVLMHALAHNEAWLSAWQPMLGGYIARDR